MPGSNVSGSIATFTISDGGVGDDDLAANGTIVDPSGVTVSTEAAAAVPTLSQWGQVMLSALMFLIMVWVQRSRHKIVKRAI
jgi:hypothetical protein